MFIHWGLYSQIGQGEWTFLSHNHKMEDYKKLKDTFTAEDFDAEKLVLTAKNAGCKYINLTTRHHEGFSLYDTCGLNDFDSVHSPAKRDLIKEYVDACNKHGIVPFFTIQLWIGITKIIKTTSINILNICEKVLKFYAKIMVK